MTRFRKSLFLFLAAIFLAFIFLACDGSDTNGPCKDCHPTPRFEKTPVVIEVNRLHTEKP